MLIRFGGNNKKKIVTKVKRRDNKQRQSDTSANTSKRTYSFCDRQSGNEDERKKKIRTATNRQAKIEREKKNPSHLCVCIVIFVI